MDFLYSARDLVYSATRTGSSHIGWGPSYYAVDGKRVLPLNKPLQLVYFYFIVGSLTLGLLFAILTARRRIAPTAILSISMLSTWIALANSALSGEWLLAHSEHFVSTYCMFSPGMYVQAEMRIAIGLGSYNVTYNSNQSELMRYNDVFPLVFGGRSIDLDTTVGSNAMAAIARGLPNPVISVAEQIETPGFPWASAFVWAGYYTHTALLFAGLSAAFTLTLMVFLPPLGIKMMICDGVLLCVSCLVYYMSISRKARTMRVEGALLEFKFGKDFLIVLAVGLINIATGVSFLLAKRVGILSVTSTFFEADYDTPWAAKELVKQSELKRGGKDPFKPFEDDEDDEGHVFVFRDNAIAQKKKEKVSLFYVDAKLRGSMKRFRQSFLNRRRVVSERITPEEGIENKAFEGDAQSLRSNNRRSLSEMFYADEVEPKKELTVLHYGDF